MVAPSPQSTDDFRIKISSRRVELQPVLHKKTLEECPQAWSVWSFALQEHLSDDAPEVAAPLTLRWTGRPRTQRDVVMYVKDLSSPEGPSLKQQVCLSSRNNNKAEGAEVKGFYMLPGYRDITSLEVAFHHCDVPAKGKDRFSHPNHVAPHAFQHLLIHFFKSDGPQPSTNLLRRQNNAIDRILTTTFRLSLLHIQNQQLPASGQDHTAAGQSAQAPPTGSSDMSHARDERYGGLTSSDADLFPSVGSQSPASCSRDAEVFMDSGSRAHRRYTLPFTKKLLGQEDEPDPIEEDEEEMPSSPPQHYDDEEEENEEEREDISEAQRTYRNDLSKWPSLGDSNAEEEDQRQSDSSVRSISNHDDQEEDEDCEPFGDKQNSLLDNSYHAEVDRSCTSPPPCTRSPYEKPTWDPNDVCRRALRHSSSSSSSSQHQEEQSGPQKQHQLVPSAVSATVVNSPTKEVNSAAWYNMTGLPCTYAASVPTMYELKRAKMQKQVEVLHKAAERQVPLDRSYASQLYRRAEDIEMKLIDHDYDESAAMLEHVYRKRDRGEQVNFTYMNKRIKL